MILDKPKNAIAVKIVLFAFIWNQYSLYSWNTSNKWWKKYDCIIKSIWYWFYSICSNNLEAYDIETELKFKNDQNINN